MLHDLCFKIEIFKVGEKVVEELSHRFSKTWWNLFNQSFQPPSRVADQVKSEGKNGTKDWCGEAGEKKGDRGNEAEFKEDEEDGDEHFPFYGEGVEKDQGQENEAHKKKHDKKGKNQPEKLT